MDSVTAILKVTKQSSLSELSVSSTRFDKRIEFHLARKPRYTGFSNGGGTYQLEALRPDSDTSNSNSNDYQLPKKVDASEATDNGLDQELSFGITFRRIGAGLANLGNTCFLNSVLQCLTYTEPLAAYLQSGKHQSSCRTAGFCALCAIQKHVSSALQSTGRILVPKEIVSNLRCISGNFRNSRQEDAHEYMVSLLESMHKCCLPSGVPSESPSAYDKSSVHKIFGGQLCSQVKCMQCFFSSDKFEPFLDLSLEIVKVDSLYKALVQFTAKEFLDGGESHYQCQQCKQKVKALKQLTIHKAPYVLTVHLKRFGHLGGQKIDKKICFETTLDLKPFVTDPCLQDGDLKYTLYGVLVHAGWSTHSGHYYCFVRTSTGLWYSLDDNQVIQVGEKMVLEQNAYMLFYYRDRRHSSSLKSFDVAQKHNADSTEKAKLYGGLGQELKETLRGQIGTKVPGGVECLVQKDSSDKSSSLQLEDNSIITLSNAKAVECGQDTSDKEQANNLIVAASRSETVLKSVNDSTLCDSGGILPKGSNSENSQKGLDDSVATSTSCSLPEISPIVIAEETEKVFSGEDPSWSSMDKIKAVRTATATDISYIQATVPEASTLPATKHKSTQRKVHDEKSNGRLKKKFSKFPTMKMHLSSKISLGTFLSVRKKHKNRKVKLVTTNLIQERLVDGNNSPDLEPSTSQKCQTTQFGGLNHSERRRESCGFKKEKCCVVNNMVLNLNGDPMANNKVERNEKTEENCAMLASNDPTQRKTARGSAANSLDDRGPCHSKDSTKESLQNRSICSKDNRNDSMKNGVMSVLTRGLEETIVARWDEMGSYATHRTEQSDRGNGSIGYVGDEWDEEYDRGKRKKIRTFKDDFGGPNPFQEIATMKTKIKKARMGYSTSGNKPFRI